MAEFLSPTWIQELDRAVRASAGVCALAPIVIEQVVSGVPGRGEVRYRIRVGADGAARVEESAVPTGSPSDAPSDSPSDVVGRPDVRLTTDYGTAVAISRGTENAQIALAHGRLRLGGDVEALVRQAVGLAALDDATAALRGSTTYPSP